MRRWIGKGLNVGNVSDTVRNSSIRNGEGERDLRLECAPWLCYSLESGLGKALLLPLLSLPAGLPQACICFCPTCTWHSILWSIIHQMFLCSSPQEAEHLDGRCCVFFIFDFPGPQRSDLSQVGTTFSPISLPLSHTGSLSYIVFPPSHLHNGKGQSESWAQRPLAPAPKLALLIMMLDAEVLKLEWAS